LRHTIFVFYNNFTTQFVFSFSLKATTVANMLYMITSASTGKMRSGLVVTDELIVTHLLRSNLPKIVETGIREHLLKI